MVVAGAWAAAEEAAYGAFYVHAFPRVLRTSYLVLHDRAAAEDVTQEAFIQLYVHWRKIASYEVPEAWVRRVALRLATRAAQRDRRRAVLSLWAAAPQASAQPSDTDIDLARAVAALKPVPRAVVVLYYYEDQSVADIARLLGRSQGSVKVTLHRARQALAQRVGVEAGPDV